MEKLWAKDVKEGERVKSVFLVARKTVNTAKSGKTYLAVTFQDKTGELEARAFENVEGLVGSFDERDYVEVEGPIGTFQGKPQLKIESVSRADAATIEVTEFAWAPPPEPKKPEKSGYSDAEEQTWRELQALVDAVTDPNVKTLIRAFVDDEDIAARLRRAPAAKTVHHAYPGGLLEHTVSSLKLAHRLADHYPQVDRDLLVAGAFFHDLGKIRELSLDRNTEYTDEGRLIGHHVMTAQWIHDKARRNGVPRELETHIVHLVLAHHGKVEYGSPRPPMTLEALLTHYIDELDSRVNSWLNLMGRDGGTRRWTDAQNIYQQHIWRGTLPTVQAEKKGPAAEALTPVIYVPRGGGQPQRHQEPRPEKKAKPPRPPRPERKPEPRAEGVEARPEAKPAEGAAVAERPPRPERPEREARPHGGGFGGGDRGPRGPGDRKPRYMGPRLPGDKGPQARPAKNLTHNPFAALAAKLEGGTTPEGAPAEHPAEAAPEAPEASAAPVPPEQPQAPVETPAPAPESGATPAEGENR